MANAFSNKALQNSFGVFERANRSLPSFVGKRSSITTINLGFYSNVITTPYFQTTNHISRNKNGKYRNTHFHLTILVPLHLGLPKKNNFPKIRCSKNLFNQFFVMCERGTSRHEPAIAEDSLSNIIWRSTFNK